VTFIHHRQKTFIPKSHHGRVISNMFRTAEVPDSKLDPENDYPEIPSVISPSRKSGIMPQNRQGQFPPTYFPINCTLSPYYTTLYNVLEWITNFITTGWTIGVLGFDSRRGLGIFLFTTASRTTLWPTQPPIQWVPGSLSLGVKRPGREADHLSPPSAEVKVWVELYLHSLNTSLLSGAQLKQRDNFIFY
jgi:hypothetical protein